MFRTLLAIAVILAAIALLIVRTLAWERRHPEDRAASERAEAERREHARGRRARLVAALSRLYRPGALRRRLARKPGYEYTELPPRTGITVAPPVARESWRSRRAIDHVTVEDGRVERVMDGAA